MIDRQSRPRAIVRVDSTTGDDGDTERFERVVLRPEGIGAAFDELPDTLPTVRPDDSSIVERSRPPTR